MSRAPGLLFGVLITATAPVHADVFKLFAQVDGGGMVGKGTSGDQKAAAFYAKAPPGMYGAQIGAELLFLDGYIQHHQFTDGSRISTWTQFGLGLHFELDFAKDAKPADADKAKQPSKAGKSGGFAEIGFGAWFGLGTGEQVNPPLDNAQVTDKALTLEGRVGLGTHLNNVFDVGVQLPISYGFFVKNGNGATANDLSTHYRGVQGEVIVYLRGNIRLF